MKKLSIIAAFAITLSIFSIGIEPHADAKAIEDLTFGGLISQKDIESHGHKEISNRLSDELNAIEFINDDGTGTVYSFPVNIKYIDGEGRVQKIDNRITEDKYKGVWKNTSNRFEVSICENAKSGTTLSYDDITLKTVVNDNSSIAVNQRSDNIRENRYVDFSGSGTKISVTPTYTGYATYIRGDHFAQNETISLDITGDDISHHYVTDTNDAVFEMQDGSKVVYSILSFTNNENTANWPSVDVTIQQTTNNSHKLIYNIQKRNRTVAEESLTFAINSDIQYAPTNDGIALTNAGNTLAASLQTDAGVYSNNASRNYGSSDRYLVGVDGTMGTCRAYIRFDINTLLAGVPFNRILSANYRIRELTGYNTSFQAEAYMVTDSWTESGITWNNKPAYNSEKLTTVNVEWQGDASGYNPGYYNFYITAAVMAWKQGIPNNGIMLKSRTENTVKCRAFASSEYSAYLPQFSVTYSTEVASMDNIGISDGTTYYLKNKNCGLYLTVLGTTSGTIPQQKAFTGNTNQQWLVSLSEDGEYYRLVPLSAPSMSLSIPGGSQYDGAYAEIAPSADTVEQYFKFIRNWDGSYQIVTKLTNDLRGIRSSSNKTADGTNIQHYEAYVRWLKSDDWTLEPVDKGMADVFTFSGQYNDGLNTHQFAANTISALNSMGYITYDMVDASYYDAYSWMDIDQLWIFSGHGGHSCIQFNDLSNKEPRYITAADDYDERLSISNKAHNALSKLQLVLYSSCNTGEDDPGTNSNMIGMTYQRGAHFVIGNSDWTSAPNTEHWIQKFFEYCSQGYTVYEAMNKADDYLYTNVSGDNSYANANQRHYLGDNSLCLHR